MLEWFTEELQEKARREKKINRVLDGKKKVTSHTWQTINYGAAEIAYCSMDSIIDTMNYTLACDRYE